MFRRIICLLSLLIAAICSLSAKDLVEVRGEYAYAVPMEISLKVARERALLYAQQEALIRTFGLLVHQETVYIQADEDGEASEKFLSMDGSELKGEWIEDITPPRYEQYNSEFGNIVIKATVHGYVREIKHAQIDISAKVLRNGTTADYESDTFLSGNDLYLLFQSPTEGYVAVYLVDEGENAYCLLPYQNQSSSSTYVESGKEYLFFRQDAAPVALQPYVDEYTLTAFDAVEINQLYIIFSPSSFTKANDTGGGEAIPRQLTFKEFQQWLSSNRRHDDRMQVMVKSVTIKP